jgi:methylated-DNA-[protein]-cysteine S-methyltransferase
MIFRYMAAQMKYAIFSTAWGYFGLVADKKGLVRTILPCENRKTVEKRLLAGLNSPQCRKACCAFDKNLLKPLQKQIIAYFEGKPARFNTSLDLDKLAPFARKVLAACEKIPAGKTISYSQLAGMINKPRASRAVGSALARNPIPLIIPCHRVIHSDGSLGNFSAPGGTSTKKKLLALETKVHKLL